MLPISATSSSSLNSPVFPSLTATLGKRKVRFHLPPSFPRSACSSSPLIDAFMNVMKPNAEALVKLYGQQSPPDPAILFSLPNQVRAGSGMYGFQKTYSGKWAVDIFFDLDELPSGLDSAFFHISSRSSRRC